MRFGKYDLGIDIGSRTIKGLALKTSGRKVILDAYFFHDLSRDNITYPFVEGLAKTLASIIDAKGLSGRQAIVNIQDTDLLTHDLNLPEMPPNDLKIALQNNIEDQFSLSGEQACMDFVKLGTTVVDGHQLNQYKIYCAKRERVNSVMDMVVKSGLKAKVIDSSVLAQVAMLKFNGYIQEPAFAIMDLGESHSTISIIMKEKVHSINTLPVGLGMINRILLERNNLTYLESEQLKIKFDLNAPFTDERQGGFDETLNEIIYPLQRMIGFFRVQLRDQELKSLFLTGGGSQMTGLAAALQLQCGLKTVVVNPFRNIDIYPRHNPSDDILPQLAPYMSTAVGFALRGIDV